MTVAGTTLPGCAAAGKVEGSPGLCIRRVFGMCGAPCHAAGVYDESSSAAQTEAIAVTGAVVRWGHTRE